MPHAKQPCISILFNTETAELMQFDRFRPTKWCRLIASFYHKSLVSSLNGFIFLFFMSLGEFIGWHSIHKLGSAKSHRFQRNGEKNVRLIPRTDGRCRLVRPSLLDKIFWLSKYRHCRQIIEKFVRGWNIQSLFVQPMLFTR